MPDDHDVVVAVVNLTLWLVFGVLLVIGLFWFIVSIAGVLYS